MDSYEYDFHFNRPDPKADDRLSLECDSMMLEIREKLYGEKIEFKDLPSLKSLINPCFRELTNPKVANLLGLRKS